MPNTTRNAFDFFLFARNPILVPPSESDFLYVRFYQNILRIPLLFSKEIPTDFLRFSEAQILLHFFVMPIYYIFHINYIFYIS